MKEIWFLLSFLLSFFFSLFCWFTFADLAGYTITSYDVDMDLYEDGSMDVTEKINVNFTQSRHGIYRTIPYYNDSGRYTIIENLKADGDQYSAYDEGGNYQLRIGSPNSTLIWPKTYYISYRVKNIESTFSSGDYILGEPTK